MTIAAGREYKNPLTGYVYDEGYKGKYGWALWDGIFYSVFNSSGTAQLQTQWAAFVKKGAPIGNAKVTLIKHVGLPTEYAPKEDKPEMKPAEFKKLAKKIEAEIDRQREVPKALSYHKTTPLEINVLRQKNELIVDLAEIGK